MSENVKSTGRVAIQTKYLGPTNSRGSRIKAERADGGESVTVPYDYALSTSDNHAAAIQALVDKLDWADVTWVMGATQKGYVAVGIYNKEGN